MLTNVDNTIQGKGSLGNDRVRIINEPDGILIGNDPGSTLFVGVSPGTASINRGLITAASGGNLTLSAGEFDNSDGLIEPQSDSSVTVGGTASVLQGILNATNDSTIQFAGSGSVTDVTLRSTGTGKYEVISGTPSMTDSTNESTVTIQNTANLVLAGTIDNPGEIVISNSGSFTDLQINETASLTGGGFVTLQGPAAIGSTITDATGADGVLTNVDNTIQGKGAVGFNRVSIINQAEGTIHANESGGTLVVDPSDEVLANEGTLRASNEATLNVVGTLENYGRMEGDSTIDSSVAMLNAGAIAPGISVGNSIGSLTLGNDIAFSGESVLEIELGATTGTAGIDWDQLVVNGTLDLSAANLLTIKLTSLDSNGDPGLLSGFDANTSVSWRIADCNDITGFSTGVIAIDSFEFQNSIEGIFIVAQSGDQLFLNYLSDADQTNSNSFSTVRGILRNGDLSSVLDSDDQTLEYNPGFTLNSNEPPVWVEFESSVSGSPDWLNVRIESRANTINILQTVEMFNWTTNSFEEITALPTSFNVDAANTISVPMPSRFIQAGTGNVKSRVGWRQDGFILLFPWTVNIDQVIWLTQ